MSKRRSNARLFEADGYTFKCWIDPLDAVEKYNRGELDLALHPVSGEAIGYCLRDSFQASDPVRPNPSQSSISLAEMLLNVGLLYRSQDHPSLEAIAAAHRKIFMWPLIWDERATNVSYEMKLSLDTAKGTITVDGTEIALDVLRTLANPDRNAFYKFRRRENNVVICEQFHVESKASVQTSGLRES